jgi:hypothetical protein
MEKSEEYKECPECAEDIKVKAFSCRYCGATVAKREKIEGGSFIRVVLKAEDKIYHGDIYLTDLMCHFSDIMNDDRKFIPIANTTQEIGDDHTKIGFFLLNKSIIHWIHEEKDVSEKEDLPSSSNAFLQKNLTCPPKTDQGAMLV